MLNLILGWAVLLVVIVGAYEYWQRQPRRRLQEAQESVVRHSHGLMKCRPVKLRRHRGLA